MIYGEAKLRQVYHFDNILSTYVLSGYNLTIPTCSLTIHNK